jgi:uncharacterized protein YjeT (DUF2065 family)
MEALRSLLDSLAWPEYPTTPGAQAAFIATAIVIVFGLASLLFPSNVGRFLGLESRATRPGAIGEIRVAGGFQLGLALIVLLFDQPVLYTLLGLALALAAFGRILAMMSDHAATIRNMLILAVQAALAAAALAHFFDTFPNPIIPAFALPDAIEPRLALYAHAALVLMGALTMFAPRLASSLPGLASIGDGGYAALRSAGGFALVVGTFAVLFVANPDARDTPFDKLLYVNMVIVAALSLSIIGRLIALALNRGNFIYALIALLAELAACAAVMAYVGAIMG